MSKTPNTETAGATFPVMEVSDLDMVFPCDVSKLMPKYAYIPDEFKRGNNKWNRLAREWFFVGVKALNITPKPGIDKTTALRHIKTIIGSFEPKHEHKEAACAYLMSQWFTDATWTRAFDGQESK